MLRYVMSCSLCQEETVMFCSPFRRRRKTRRPEESQLSREEAWSLYWAKLEEEANYFSVGDTAEDEDTDICTCHTCIVSEEQLSQNYVSGWGLFSVVSPANLPHATLASN